MVLSVTSPSGAALNLPHPLMTERDFVQYYAEEEEEKEKAVGQETPAQSVQEAKT